MLICLCRLMYFEIKYFEEWYKFHKKQGVNLFYVYVKYLKGKKDNNIFEDLKNKYENQDDIFFFHVSNSNGRHIGIKSFLNNNYEKYKEDWLLYIDIDEFCYSPLKDKKITDIINLYEKEEKFAIYINWIMFGCSNLICNSNNKVLDKFNLCADKNFPHNMGGKSLVKINTIDIIKHCQNLNAHKFSLKVGIEYNNSNCETFHKKNLDNKYNFITNLKYIYGKKRKQIEKNIKKYINHHHLYISENPNLIINHYTIKSKDEYLKKINIFNKEFGYNYYTIEKFNKFKKLYNIKLNKDILNKL